MLCRPHMSKFRSYNIITQCRTVPRKLSWRGLGLAFADKNWGGRLHMGVVDKFWRAYKIKLRRYGNAWLPYLLIEKCMIDEESNSRPVNS